MAEGGGYFGLYNPYLDYDIDNEPYDDYDDDEQELDTTRPFCRAQLQLPITVESKSKCKLCSTSRAVFLILLMKKQHLFCLVQSETLILKEGLPL